MQKGAYRTMDDDKGKRHDTGGNLFVDKYWKSADEVKEDVKGYPQPTVWGNLPSYGFFIRHVEQVSIDNLELASEGMEPREPIILVDVDKYITDNNE